MITSCVHAHPDHSLELVLDRLHKNQGILPVVSRERVREVQGIITPQTVMQFLQKTCGEPSTVATVEKDASSG